MVIKRGRGCRLSLRHDLHVYLETYKRPHGSSCLTAVVGLSFFCIPFPISRGDTLIHHTRLSSCIVPYALRLLLAWPLLLLKQSTWIRSPSISLHQNLLRLPSMSSPTFPQCPPPPPLFLSQPDQQMKSEMPYVCLTLEQGLSPARILLMRSTHTPILRYDQRNVILDKLF